MDLATIAPIIVSVDTNGDYVGGIKGMRATLINGWEVSIITGGPLHGGREGLFEIAPIAPDGDFRDDEVQGYLTSEEVIKTIEEIATR